MNKIFSIKSLIVVAIIILAFMTRFYKLGTVPALNADEAAIGYNAYSLLLTGKDEHGNSWPIHFQSFNDYKPGLYFYVVLPFVKLLGLNIWAVRIPAALMGVLTVYLVYLLVKELFNDERFAIVSSLLLSISPWHIHFSRGGWEVNVATFFLTLGVWLFVKSAKIGFELKSLTLGILSFVASLYTYHAARVIIPLLGIFLVFHYWKQMSKNIKGVLVAGVIGILLVIPLAKDIATGAVASRAAGVGLFADPGPLSRVEEQRGEHSDLRSILARALHNKVVNYGLAFASNWTLHYWGEFLFLSGDVIQRNRVPETGQLYMVEIVFVVAGIYFVVKKYRNEWGLIIFWLLIAPVAAALTFQAPHALRADNMVIPITIISAFGLCELIALIEKMKRPLKNTLLVTTGILLLWSFARYEHMYWVHMTKEYPYSSQYGLHELVLYVSENESKYQKVLVTDRYDQPYILFLFYLKYNPAKFQSEHVLTPRDGFGFSTVNHFGKYYFASIKFDEARPDNPNTLIAGTDEEIPKEANVVKEIYGANGYKYFDLVAN